MDEDRVNVKVKLVVPIGAARDAIRKAMEAALVEDVPCRVVGSLADALGAMERLYHADCAGPNDVAAAVRDADDALKRPRDHIRIPHFHASTNGNVNAADKAVVHVLDELRRHAPRGWREVRTYEWERVE